MIKNDLIQLLVKILKISPKSKKKIEKNIKIKNKLFSNQRIKIFTKNIFKKSLNINSNFKKPLQKTINSVS